MMYLPRLFSENLMDDFFSDFDRDFFPKRNPLYGHRENHLMKTDVRETENAFELDVDLPGFNKDQLELTLENGYLTITAEKGLDKEEKDNDSGKVIRRERYSGKVQRCFYVGDEVSEEDIGAKLENGVLALTIPKKVKQPELPEKKTIAIQ